MSFKDSLRKVLVEGDVDRNMLLKNIIIDARRRCFYQNIIFFHITIRVLSFIFLNAGRGKEALVNYKTALQLNPNHTVALVNMGRHLRAAGNIQEAEQAYKRALSVKQEPSTLQLLGVLYYHKKQLKEAELAWKQALELDPSNLDTRSNYAVLLGQTNRLNEAVSILKGLVLDDPNNQEHYK
ncbi:transmembrane and TPR repeat-containing protein 1-like, partial [Orbicella faveolata]|uniref:transmembrane and TPR repeat-containing protein 1-like n=1 Tax=Orbicella faveolata TaxID=48498 RepID=UPI0009E63C3B